MYSFVRNKNKKKLKLEIETGYYDLGKLNKETIIDNSCWTCQGGGRMENQVGVGLTGDFKCLNAVGLCFISIFITSGI